MKILAERETDGILVRLFWDESAEPGDDLILRYRDQRRRRSFTARPPRERALHAFYHPNAYAPAGLPDAA
ncbi:MAG: hypothetical protein ACRDON_08540 [Gaiellaceae bacterium]